MSASTAFSHDGLSPALAAMMVVGMIVHDRFLPSADARATGQRV